MRRARSPDKDRTFSIGSDCKSSLIASNHIQTSKYTKLTFLPKSILMQFTKTRTIYFLINVVIVLVPEISPLAPLSTIIPFIFLIAFDVLLEGLRDFPNQHFDHKVNSKTATRIGKSGGFDKVRWDAIKVGNLILVREEDEIPADIILLATSNQENIAYVDATNVYGYDNSLQRKFASSEMVKYFDNDTVKDERLYKCTIQAAHPSSSIYSFQGVIITENGHRIPLDIHHLLLGRSKLKKTCWALGVVVYAGLEMKIMMGSVLIRRKKIGQGEKLVNKIMNAIILFQLALCVLLGILNYVSCSHNLSGAQYLGEQECNAANSFFDMLTYFTLTSTMVPIFLVVSVDIVKLVHAFFIENDQDMFSSESRNYPKVFNSSIVESLGLVKYVFLDKTGVLTDPTLTFRNFMIGNKIYGKTAKEIQQDHSLASSTLVLKEQIQADITGEGFDLEIRSPFRSQRELVFEFMQAITICHDCVAEREKNSNKIVFHGRSQEEIAGLDIAREAGFIYFGNSGANLRRHKMRLIEEEKEVEVVHVFDFSYPRRRMSILIRDRGVLKLYTKGSEGVVFERLNKDFEQSSWLKVQEKLEDYVEEGCRWLVYAMRIVEEEEYHAIIEEFGSSLNREEDLANAFEKDLVFLGCSILDNKLEKNVTEVIDDLYLAGMKFFMVTGDRLETAEIIARRSHLIKEDTDVIRYSGRNEIEVKDELNESSKLLDISMRENRKTALVLDGVALRTSLRGLFASIVLKCDSVICAHVTPKQKAELVHLIKIQTGKVTLAVGDGANDINMIQAADIGIGLYGQEGIQAVQASDFAIAEFQSLWRLLLVHGRWSYLRISEMTLYFFYKNMLFTLPQVFFGIECSFTGQTIYEDYYVTFYNLMFTALPLVIKAILEQDINYKRIRKSKIRDQGSIIEEDQEIKDKFAMLYNYNRNNPIFTVKTLLKWLGEGVIVSAIVYFCAVVMIGGDLVINSQGLTGGMWYFSITLYSTVILIVDVRLALSTRSWTWLYTVILIISVLFYFAYTGFYDSSSFSASNFTVGLNYGSIQFYCFMLLMTGISFLVDLTFKTLKDTGSMPLAETLREQQKQKRGLKYQTLSMNTGLYCS